MKSIRSTSYSIHFQEDAFNKLSAHLLDFEYSKVFILVDENTNNYCLPYFLEQLPNTIDFDVITINAGERYKNIETCLDVWKALTELKADRKSLLINLGGGMVTDLGGFVASTYKRGIHFINIPTTLLSMVDASVGSKTGIDLENLKNLIGCFSDPQMVLVNTMFLKTMMSRDFNSGVAEIIKYGLTYDKNLWEALKSEKSLSNGNLEAVIHRSIEIKNEIVLKDLKETSLRKILNFGHTVGHAIESYFLDSNDKNELLHGEAIGIGMIIEAYASQKLLAFPESELKTIKNKVIDLYGRAELKKSDYQPILALMKHDKKNIGDAINFILLEAIGAYKIDYQVPQAILMEAFDFYSA